MSGADMQIDIVPDGTGGTYEHRWACEPPPEGSAFKVVRDVWSEDYSVRTIHEWTPA